MAEYFLEDRNIVLAQSHDVAHLLWHLLRIEDHVVPHRLVVREGNQGVQPFQALLQDRIRDRRGEMYRVHVIFKAR